MAAPSAHAAASVYSIVDLGTLGGSYSAPRAIDEAGDVVGTSTTAGGDRHAFLYSGGTMRDLGTLGGSRSEAYGINDAGQVVGESTTASGDTHAFLYSGGLMLDLGTLGGTYSSAAAINTAGDVVGTSTTATGDSHGFIYSAGVMRDLGTLGGSASGANGINDVGQVVGSSQTAAGGFTTRSFVVSGDSMADLGIGGTAESIDDAGQIAGTAPTFPTSANHAYLTSGGVTTDLGVLLYASYAEDLNSAGDVVGYSTSMEGGAWTAFLYSGGVLHELSSMIPADSGWVSLRAAYAINDGGQIAGTGDPGSGGTHAFLMTPPPGPDTTPPSAPGGLAVTAAIQTSVSVSWNAATDNVGTAGYILYLDGAKAGSTTSTSFTFTGLGCGTSHTVAAESVDTSGNVSARVSLSAATAACDVSGPVALYRLDDDSGTAAADASGDGHSGSLVGGASWAAVGKLGGGLVLDGASGHVDLPPLGLFYRQSFTLEAWVKASTAEGDAGIVGTFAWDANGGPMLWVDSSGRFGLTLNRGATNYLVSPESITPGLWQHVAATYDGTTASLYVDGVLAASKPFGGDVGDSNNWRIGAYGASATGFFAGAIDEVRVYGRALSASEISQDMGPPAATAPPSAPTGLAVTNAGDGAISVSWDAAPQGVTLQGYDLLRDGVDVGSTKGTTYDFTGLDCTTAYGLAVEAVDTDGQASAPESISASTTPCAPPVASYSFDTPSDSTDGTWTSAGRVGGALVLGGAPAHLDLPALGTFYKRGFTLAAWVNEAVSGAGDAAILGTWTAEGNGGPMLWIDGSGDLRLTLNQGYANYVDSGYVLPAGEWHHVVGTYDGSTARIYVDGKLAASLPFSGNVGDSDTWRIGAYGTTPVGYFAGLVDEVRIYDRALSAAEIASLASAVASAP